MYRLKIEQNRCLSKLDLYEQRPSSKSPRSDILPLTVLAKELQIHWSWLNSTPWGQTWSNSPNIVSQCLSAPFSCGKYHPYCDKLILNELALGFNMKKLECKNHIVDENKRNEDSQKPLAIILTRILREQIFHTYKKIFKISLSLT